jgi:protein-disulfide isomerase
MVIKKDGTYSIMDFIAAEQPSVSIASPEEKYNPYHEPATGRFTHAPGGGAAFASAQAKVTAEIDVITKQYAATYKDYFRTDDDEKAAQLWQELDDMDTLRNKLISQRERGKANIMQLAVRNIAKEDKAMANRLSSTMKQLAGGSESLFQGAF